MQRSADNLILGFEVGVRVKHVFDQAALCNRVSGD